MRDLSCCLRVASAAVGAAAVMCATTASAMPPNTHTLRVSHSGGGFVASTDGRIRCGARCSAAYAQGALVTLTASAGAEYEFEGWRRACVGNAPRCMIALDRDAAVRAAFRHLPPPPTPPPVPPPPPPVPQCSDGIDNDGDALIDYPSDPGCADALDSDERDSPPPPPRPPPAAPPPPIGVTVSVSGSGFIRGGTIRCGGAAGTLLDCEGLFSRGVTVVLRAFPKRRGGFVGWGGFCRGKARTCILRATAPKTVLAVFRR
jgi:Divergent InlB B-repeat domain